MSLPSIRNVLYATLFDADKGQCASEFLELSFASVGDELRFQHRLFVIANSDGVAAGSDSYELTCDIKLCENSDSHSVCDAIRTTESE